MRKLANSGEERNFSDRLDKAKICKDSQTLNFSIFELTKFGSNHDSKPTTIFYGFFEKPKVKIPENEAFDRILKIFWFIVLSQVQNTHTCMYTSLPWETITGIDLNEIKVIKKGTISQFPGFSPFLCLFQDQGFLAILLPITSFAFLDKIVLRLSSCSMLFPAFIRGRKRKRGKNWVSEVFLLTPVSVCIQFLIFKY